MTRSHVFLGVLACLGASLAAPAAESKLFRKTNVFDVHKISTAGIGEKIGTLTLADAAGGLSVTPNLGGLPPGGHGFHVHVNPDCGAADKDGMMTAGQAAGGHFDPESTGKHLGPSGPGHKGDMPVINVNADGTATAPVIVPRLSLKDVRGHAIMIHEGGDNYSDTPKPLGGGGGRIACTVIK